MACKIIRIMKVRKSEGKLIANDEKIIFLYVLLI